MSSSRARFLYIVEPQEPNLGKEDTAQQLGLIGLEPARSAVISVPASALHRSRLSRLLHQYKPRQIVDVRMSPSFRALDFTEDMFLSKVSSLMVTYRTCPSLANRFAGYSWEPRRMWQLYAQHLDGQSAELESLRDAIEQGPVALVSAEERHDTSVRKHVIDALRQIRPGFDIVIHE